MHVRWGLFVVAALSQATCPHLSAADDPPAAPAPAVQKKVIQLPRRQLAPGQRPGQTADANRPVSTAGLVLADRTLLVTLSRAGETLKKAKYDDRREKTKAEVWRV